MAATEHAASPSPPPPPPHLPSSDARMQARYWEHQPAEFRTRVSDFTNLVDLHLQLAMAICAWHDIDDRYQLTARFLSHNAWDVSSSHIAGSLLSHRKVLSYAGVIDGRGDLGNYNYSVACKVLSASCGPHDVRKTSFQTQNDVTNGDVVEAIMGLLWWRQQGDANNIFPGMSNDELAECVRIMNHALLWTEVLVKTHADLGMWVDSCECAKHLY